MYPKMIFGLGTGRCGTSSLTALLNKQTSTHATHEGDIIPWESHDDLMPFYQAVLFNIFNTPPDPKIKTRATIAFYWVNYISEIIRDVRDVRIIALKRKREEVVQSFSNMYQGENLWSNPKWAGFDGKKPLRKDILSQMFPKYNASKEAAIGLYWDYYYTAVDYYVDRFPETVIQVDTYSMFNNADYQRAALAFLGYKRPVVDLDIKKAATAERMEPLLIERRSDIWENVQKASNNRYIFGQSAAVKGLDYEPGIELSDSEWRALMALPGIENVPGYQKEG